MRLAFAGTPDFAAIALRQLIAAGHTIALVLTRPDKPSGRGLRVVASPVKALAEEHSLPLFQPASLKIADQQEPLKAAAPDLIVVAAYGLILPQAVLDLPKHGCMNIHASLLPRWRGAAPIQRAILAGDSETGITIMQMDAGLDTGPMLLREVMPIEANETAGTLHDKLAHRGGKLIVRAIDELLHGRLNPTSQPESGATYAAKIDKREAEINWTTSAVEIERKVRAFNPVPGAATAWQGEPLKIWAAGAIAGGMGSPGQVLHCSADGIEIQCGSGRLIVRELQRGGGKRLTTPEFLRGVVLAAGERFGR